MSGIRDRARGSKRAWRKPAIIVVIGLLVLDVVHPFCWVSLPIKGLVIDARSGAPVAEAVVAANWSLLGAGTSVPASQLKVVEAVTDQQGRFDIPGWVAVHFGATGVPGTAPEIWGFRRGYLPAKKTGSAWYRGAFPIMTMPAQQFRLEPASSVSAPAYGRAVTGMTAGMAGNFTNDPCQLTRLPAMLTELRTVSAELNQAGVSAGAVIWDPRRIAACN